MKLYIKNMVCDRCKMAVKAELEKLGIMPTVLELGEVELQETPKGPVLAQLEHHLQQLGFELVDDKKSRIINKIKSLIISQAHHAGHGSNLKLSELLAQELHYDYNYLSNLFSEVEGITIEKYFIKHRIEKVKELLMYDELTLNEIAYKLGFSSSAYLSNQFKKLTGLTPSFYKSLKENKRRNIDSL